MSDTPNTHDDYNDLPQIPILGLDGLPVEITDEKLHELIDAMNSSRDFAVVDDPDDELMQSEDYMIATQIMGGIGEMALTEDNSVSERCIVLSVGYRCGSCDEMHALDVGVRVVPSTPAFFDLMAHLARKVQDAEG